MTSLAKAQNMRDAASLYEVHIRDALSAIKVTAKDNLTNAVVIPLFSSYDRLDIGVGPSIHHTVFYSVA